MKIIATIAMVVLLSACASNKALVTKERRIVVMPPEGLWDCPEAPPTPEGDYTQAEVADYVLRLYEAHKVCEGALKDVREYLENASKITEQIEE